MLTHFTKLMAALAVVAIAGVADASSLIYDRGLPTANLNNAAEGNRSNVAWGFYSESLSGDMFNISASNPTAVIDQFSVWYISSSFDVDAPDRFFNLWLTADTGQPLSLASDTWTATAVAYANEDSYQGTGGGFINLYRLDFSSFNYNLQTNTDYYFAVSAQDNTTDELLVPVFLHASNAALSGSPQEGSNDLFNWFAWNSGAPTFSGDFDSRPPNQGGNGGWDKPSDINLQITGSIVPVPPAAGLILLGMAGFGLRRKFMKK